MLVFTPHDYAAVKYKSGRQHRDVSGNGIRHRQVKPEAPGSAVRRRSPEQERSHDKHHENSGDHGYGAVFLLHGKPDGSRKKGEDGQHLIAPCKIVPQETEGLCADVGPPKQNGNYDDHGNAQINPVHDFFLVDPEGLRNTQTHAPHGRVAGSDRKNNHRKHGDIAHPGSKEIRGDLGQDRIRVHFHEFREKIVNGHAAGRPDHRDNPFQNHHPVEVAPSVPFRGHGPCDDRRLCRMEARKNSAGDRDKQRRNDRLCDHSLFESGGFRQNIRLAESGMDQTRENRGASYQKDRTEKRIDRTDDLVDGKQCGADIIQENHDSGDPENPMLRPHLIKKFGRDIDEDRHHQQQKDDHEHIEDIGDPFSQRDFHQFRKVCAVMPDGHHP